MWKAFSRTQSLISALQASSVQQYGYNNSVSISWETAKKKQRKKAYIYEIKTELWSIVWLPQRFANVISQSYPPPNLAKSGLKYH